MKVSSGRVFNLKNIGSVVVKRDIDEGVIRTCI